MQQVHGKTRTNRRQIFQLITQASKANWNFSIFPPEAENKTCSYQADAGDAGVVSDVGDVEDLSFILTAGFCACKGQEERVKGRTEKKTLFF